MRHNLLLNRSRGTASLQPLVLLAIIVVMTGAQAVLVPGSLTVSRCSSSHAKRLLSASSPWVRRRLFWWGASTCPWVPPS